MSEKILRALGEGQHEAVQSHTACNHLSSSLYFNHTLSTEGEVTVFHLKQFKKEKSAYLLVSFVCTSGQRRCRAGGAAEEQRGRLLPPAGLCSHHLPAPPLQLRRKVLIIGFWFLRNAVAGVGFRLSELNICRRFAKKDVSNCRVQFKVKVYVLNEAALLNT